MLWLLMFGFKAPAGFDFLYFSVNFHLSELDNSYLVDTVEPVWAWGSMTALVATYSSKGWFIGS